MTDAPRLGPQHPAEEHTRAAAAEAASAIARDQALLQLRAQRAALADAALKKQV